MEFLTNSKIDFMKYRKFFVVVSLALLVVACGELIVAGLNLGIDFAGGTQMLLRMSDESVDEDALRRILEDAGFRETQIQRIGAEAEREMLVKTPVVAGSEEGTSGSLIAALNEALNQGQSGEDLNQRGADSIKALLQELDPRGLGDGTSVEATELYGGLADAIIAQRHSLKLFSSWDQVGGAEGMTPDDVEALKPRAFLGGYNVLSTENVGPQIGSELRQKGILAVVFALMGMLAYIWYRFELRFGIGALVAVFHDFLITLGLYALFNFEFNLPTIAAFLTLVGYSVNDTVVVFDRVRENMRKFRRRPLIDVVNLSLNQTLSRTLLTSGTTLLVVGCLFFFGGEGVRGFAFVLLVGILIGTYSSIFVASPFTLLWEQLFGGDKRGDSKASASKATA